MRQTYSKWLTMVTGILVLFVALAFALIQSPEILESPRLLSLTMAQPLPHPIEKHENCDRCHGRKGMRPYPINHLGWENESCIKCHRGNYCP